MTAIDGTGLHALEHLADVLHAQRPLAAALRACAISRRG